MAGLKAILFDNDGTLVDTRELILANFREATSTVLGKVFPDEMYLAKVGQPVDVQVLDFSDDPQVQVELARAFRESNAKLHDSMISLFPGTASMFAQLKDAGFTLGVITSKRRVVAAHGLELLGVSEYFDCVVGSEDTTKYKPNPEPITYGCNLLSLEPVSCMYVGDSPFDIDAGHAAGCLTAAVTWGMFDEHRLTSLAPSYVCHNWDELVEICGDLKE